MNTHSHAGTTWSWRPTITPELRNKVRLSTLGMVVAVAVSVGIAVVTPGRFVIVIAVMLAGMGVFWWLEHQRFRATEVSVDAAGLLRVADGREEKSIALGGVDSVAVRLRTQPGISVVASTPRWTIELAGPGASLTCAIPHAGGLFNPDAADIERLEAELTAQVEHHGGRVVDSDASRPDAPPSSIPAPSVPSGSLSDAAPARHFEWRPPVSPHAGRRRRWYRIAYGGTALAIAVYAIVSMWGDWVAVVLSALTVPGLIVAFCGGIDWMIGRSRKFRIVVDDGVLRVEPDRAGRSVLLRGATLDLDRHSTHVGSSNGTTRTTFWILAVTAADGTEFKRQMPQWGTTTREDDYVALARSLRQFTRSTIGSLPDASSATSHHDGGH